MRWEVYCVPARPERRSGMMYEFEAENGDRAEFNYPMSEAPAFGTVVEHEGRSWVRVPSVPRTNQLTPTWRHTGLTSNQFYPWTGRAEGFHKNFDAEGRPQFANKTEAREYAKRYSATNPAKVTTFDG